MAGPSSHSHQESALQDTLPRVQADSWWEWEDGSAIFFWRWPLGYLVQPWEGVSSWIKEALTGWTRTQRQENDSYVILKVSNKMSKLIIRGYITEGIILVLTSFFSVPKGTDDICIGLKDYMWAPNLMLPSMGTLLMMMDPETHMVDLEFGGIFYNFRLSSVLAKYHRVYLVTYLVHIQDCQGAPLWMRWVRIIMVPVLSSYADIQGML